MELSSKIIRALPEFIFVFNKDFIFTDVMKSDYVELFHTREELIGSSGRMIYSPELSEVFIKNINECLADGQLRLMEYSLDFGEKGIRHYEARLTPYDEENVLVLIRDVCRRVEYEKQLLEARYKAEEADRLKSEFLANISHEIRTPLNAIVGFSDYIISPEYSDAEKEEFAKIIKTNSEHLLNLINDILDLARIEAGRTEICKEEVELSGLIRNLGKSQLPKLYPGVSLRIECPDELMVVTDPKRVSQIIINLLSNAVKFTEQGEIVLKMERMENGDTKISVKDTGPGISETSLQKVFDRFEKNHSSKQGTGLGLSICKNLAELLGGEMIAMSTLGVGSEFVLVLPS